MLKPRAAIRRRFVPLEVERLEERYALAVTWSVTFDDRGRAHSGYYSQIRATLVAAGQEWGRYLHSAKASIEVAVGFKEFKDDTLATGGSETSVFFQKQGKLEVWEMSVPSEIRMGSDPNGSQRDATITLDSGSLGDLWFDPTPDNRDDDVVPSDKEDAYSLFLHELGHCLGFDGWRDDTTGKLPGIYESRFDRYVTIAADGTPYFNGPAAKTAYGNQPVPLTYSNLHHLGNDTEGTEDGTGLGRPGGDLADDLMTGTGQDWGERVSISALDLAVLQDSGLPISNDAPTISAIADQFIMTGGSGQLSFSVADRETAANQLSFRVESTNLDLIPTESLSVRGQGTERSLSITPRPGQEGTAAITIHVGDGFTESTRTFNVRVSNDLFPWRNLVLPYDVNNDGLVAPNDALMIINFINKRSAGSLPWRERSMAVAPFCDVHADNLLAPNDALEVINYINDQIAQSQRSLTATGEGEGSKDEATFLLIAELASGGNQIAKHKADAILSLDFTPPQLPR